MRWRWGDACRCSPGSQASRWGRDWRAASRAASVPLDSHFRYLSGLLAAIGFAFWSTIPRIETRGPRFRLLSAIVFVGGLGRLVSLVRLGAPDAPMLFGLTVELVITPALALWREIVAWRSRLAERPAPLN